MSGLQKHKLHVLVCANVTIHPLEEFLAEELVEYDVAVTVGGFDNVWADAGRATADFVVIHNEILNLTSEYSSRFLDAQYSREVADHIELQARILQGALIRHDAPKIIATSLSPFSLGLTRVNASVSELCYRYDRVMLDLAKAVIDFGGLLSDYGFAAAIDWASYYRYSAPYEHEFLRVLARSLATEIRIQYEGSKKVLVVDMDNTLWGGILGEDGPDRLVLDDTTPRGKCYQEVQRMISVLPTTGALLAACSKNNRHDVEGLFEQRRMPLSLASFSYTAINWHDKTTNLQNIALALNLGTNSFVFIDDSDFEIAGVTSRIPEVRCFLVPKSTFTYPYWFRRNVLSLFGGQGKTEEDAKRAAYYQIEQDRRNAQAHFMSEADFIGSLGLSLTMKIEDSTGIVRVAQMTNKTNQFNLTTKRYSEEKIAAMLLDDDFLVISGTVSDKFGDSGKTLLAIIGGCRTATPYIDTFLMSCRVIGRGLESAFIETLLVFLKAKGYRQITAKYIMTQKNLQVANFYDQMGFAQIDENSIEKEYRLSLASRQPELRKNINVDFKFETN
jgi:FkbH-like protein